MPVSYNPGLVTLSIGIAILASYTALYLASRVARGETVARLWLMVGAAAMGMGIWATHFIGMMAFSIGVPLRYDVGTTLASLGLAILGSGAALWAAGRRQIGLVATVNSALLMGGSIVAMHYVGMAAIQIVPMIGYRPLLVAASVLIGLTGSFVALFLMFHLNSGRSRGLRNSRLGASLVMGAAICAMHYTAMAASRFAPGAYCTGGIAINNQWLANVVGGLAIALLVIALAAALLDGKMKMRALANARRLEEINAELHRQEKKARTSEERLRQIADAVRR